MLAELKKDNLYLLLALDHRQSLEKKIKSEYDLVEFKRCILKYLAPLSSGVLLDPIIGLQAYKSVVDDMQLPPYLLSI